MPRKKSLTPRLYKRGVNGNWCFRRFVNGKDKEINTGTPVKPEAESYAKQYVRLEIEAENRERRGELAVKTAQTIMMTVRGEGVERLTFEEGFRIYLDTMDNFTELSERYRMIFTSTCRKFFSWCQGRGLRYLDEVSDEVARNYARLLTESHLCSKSFDDYIKILSKFFTTVDAMKKLPNRNPFNKVNIRRKQKGLVSDASHRPLEPERLSAVMKEAAESGQDWFDLFTVGLHTGMRLKDAALLQWSAVHGNFLEIVPFKTRRFGIIARVPITGELRVILDKRKEKWGFNQYINPVIADLYWRDSGYSVSTNAQKIFVRALGKENTILPKGEHRKVNTSIYSFESFRTTLTTILGSNNTEYRVIMEMLGWSSWNMLKIYEKKYGFNSEARDKEKLQSFEKLGVLSSCVNGIIPAQPRLLPTKNALLKLLPQYSNITIGKIYGITEAAVRKWLKVLGVSRTGRINSADISDEEIQKIREGLRTAA